VGHLRLCVLPTSRKWRQVVDLIRNGAEAGEIASASARAAERALGSAADDPGFRDAVRILVELPLAARSPGFAESLASLGMDPNAGQSLSRLTAAVSDARDARGARTCRLD
jgi:hypothetical protein